MEQQKTDEVIGNLYRLKELYRQQGQDVCDAAQELLDQVVSLENVIVEALQKEIGKLQEAIEKFNA